jgi:hypothetical protein
MTWSRACVKRILIGRGIDQLKTHEPVALKVFAFAVQQGTVVSAADEYVSHLNSSTADEQ